MKKKRFLFVSAHPDDVEIAAGGTILSLKQKGHKVFIVDLTSGEPTPKGTEKKRKRETENANKILEIDRRYNLGLENRHLFDTKKARFLLAEKIRVIRPDVLFCPYPDDAHPDHVAAAKITEAARFYAKYTKTDLLGKPHYPFYLFYFYSNHLRIIPEVSFFVDISKQFKNKMKAIKCYKSQFIENKSNGFVFKYIKTMNKYFGHLIRSDYAEGFYSKEVLKVSDISTFI
ncbi:MAG: bacillithiol biosynthesis deacetylase BshB1 [Candidatus Aureabacteria bacterium]|nr:bacillithiol biosynthesis deacetylase BshB1 [Candidatus Auribacterota bacterium]